MKNIDTQFGTRADLKKKLAGKEMFGKEDCPFCIDLKTNERVLWKGYYWAIIYNLYPYTHGAKHLMLIPIRHACFSHEITNTEYSELHESYDFIEKFYNGDSYFSFTRESISERSVEHVHTHFISGQLKRKTLVEMLKAQGFETSE
ncbi:hypothetical protein H7169_00245 [Candidatus Gracilibacteria bacterium]|nr:hypothetical protein [Candidatus Gracilibacteria bacterium]